MRFVFIEFPRFTKQEEECETDFERWIYVFESVNKKPESNSGTPQTDPTEATPKQ